MDPKKQQKEIKRLSRALSKKDRALSRERRINAQLRRQLAELKGSYGTQENTSRFSKKNSANTTAGEQADLLRSGLLNARRFSKKSYLRYLIQTVKESPIGLIFRRVAHYLRRLRLIRTVATVLSAIIIALLLSAVFITVLPFLILLTVIALLAVFFRARAANRFMAKELEGKHIRVIIPSNPVSFKDDTFLERSAKAMSKEKNTAILVIIPHLISTKGLGGHGIFFTVRKEDEQLYLLRKSYFFIFRRRVLDSLDSDITVMY